MTTITRRTGTYPGETDLHTIYEIADADGVAAALYIHPEHRMIMAIEVREDRRREGLATALYEHADAEDTIYHVPAWGRTDEGDAFAEAMGGEVMDDETAAAITGFDLALIA